MMKKNNDIFKVKVRKRESKKKRQLRKRGGI